MANTHDKGDLVRCVGVFTDANGDPVDPAVLIFKFKTPGGTITTYTFGVDAQLVKDSTGTYHTDVDANAAGTWEYRYEGTGTGQAAGEAHFFIKAPAL
jgi:hypothetical protein